MNEKKTITIYVHTAWNGYSWQNCPPDIAADLQMYMDATGTLPRSSTDVLPFGGAIACMIGGQTGTAVYRYLRRTHGDSAGRDCMYLVVAFIPKDEKMVEFSDIIKLDVMCKPKDGPDVRPVSVDVPTYGFVAAGETVLPKTESCRHAYRGIDGLIYVARAFQSEDYELGLLRAKFSVTDSAVNSEVDNLEILLDYKVFPEVEAVERAAHEFTDTRKKSGFIQKNAVEYLKLKEAVDAIESRAKKVNYKGLEKYIKKNTIILNEYNSVRENSANLLGRLETLLREPSLDEGEARETMEAVESFFAPNEQCKKLVSGVRSLSEKLTRQKCRMEIDRLKSELSEKRSSVIVTNDKQINPSVASIDHEDKSAGLAKMCAEPHSKDLPMGDASSGPTSGVSIFNTIMNPFMIGVLSVIVLGLGAWLLFRWITSPVNTMGENASPKPDSIVSPSTGGITNALSGGDVPMPCDDKENDTVLPVGHGVKSNVVAMTTGEDVDTVGDISVLENAVTNIDANTKTDCPAKSIDERRGHEKKGGTR